MIIISHRYRLPGGVENRRHREVRTIAIEAIDEPPEEGNSRHQVCPKIFAVRPTVDQDAMKTAHY
jgi:hypothetical protein